MPAPKMPPEMPTVTANVAAEALDELLNARPGWKSTDRGWHHKKTGLHAEARAGSSPFRLATNGTSERLFATRAALELTLIQAGA